ncbi:TonB-dependent receptor [Arhodomonas aquaeolei]|uniref:TonB-dependent receptor plug domain-containing protein n=1 Tax=Arhodomonas aquaeolei TaxID=2369 RepID=UPI0021670CDB|nr:TonB-dependent receptor [Arhodomonas aquaeolei]MCS4505413.1 TonB-dependent receptor [Arhodomonas aquaeolei]
MHHTNRLHCFTLAGCLIGASPQLLHAGDVSPQTLETVNVTASGHASETVETPHSVAVVDSDEIAASADKTVGDLLRDEAGIATYSDGAWGANPVLRGLKKEHVVILVDGVRLNSAQPAGAIASLVNTGQIERIEVVKGPVSVLYGSGAMGGVVNIITKQAGFTNAPTVSGNVGLGASSADNGRQGSASVAVSNDRHALTVNASALDTDDYDSPDGEVDHTGYRQKALSAHYHLRVGDEGRLELTAQHQHDEDVWYPGSAQPHSFHGTRTLHSPDQERSLFRVAYETPLQAATDPQLRVSAYRQDVDRQIRAYSERLGRDVVRTDVTFSTVGGGVNLDLSPGDRHVVSLGLDTWRMQGDPERYIDNNPPYFNSNTRSDPFDDGEIRSAGVYLQDEILLDRWTLKLGGRYDRVTGDADEAAGLPAGTELYHADNTLSWSAGAVYHHSLALNPYASLARAYRAAGMRERFESSTRGDGYYHQGNPDLDPEQSTTVELGLKGAAGRTRYTAAVFYSRIDDYITGRVTGETNAATGLPVKHTENLARVILVGAEADLEHDLGHHYTAYGRATYLRGENHYDDEPLAEVPPPELVLGLRHAPPRAWRWSAQARLVAEQDRVATKLTNGTEDPTAGFVTMDASAGYRFRPAGGLGDSTVRLAVTNLLDKDYHEHLTDGVSGYEPPAPGRSVHLSWHTRF